MKHIFFLLFVALLCSPTLAQNTTEHFITPDSIVFLTRDNTNLHVVTKIIDKQLHPTPFRLHKRYKATNGKHLINSDEIHSLPQPYADILRCRRAMYQLAAEGEACYADSIENLLFNSLLPLLKGKGAEQYAVARCVADLSQTMLATSGQNIYVNFYLNSWGHIHTDSLNLTIDQITTMPFFPRIKIRIGGVKTQTPFTLFLRIPAWQRTTPTFYVNGRRFRGTIKKGYFVISRRWNSGDEVYADFDFTLSRTPNGYIRRGPLLYIADASFPIIPKPKEGIDMQNHIFLEQGDKKAHALLDYTIYNK